MSKFVSVLLLLAAACATRPRTPPVAPPAPVAPAGSIAEPAPPANAVAMPRALASFDGLPGWPGPDPATALTAFRAACPALLRRTDASGLTTTGDWREPCAAANGPSVGDARAFFELHMRAVVIGGGEGLQTGYYEPLLNGSRVADSAHPHPLYRTPDDLVEADLGAFSDALAGKTVRGRVEGRRLVPYPDRAAIDGGALAGRGLELVWVDPVDAFFLQIQGSGRVRLTDGAELRLGYAAQNGRGYTPIGRVMRERGLGDGDFSMAGIVRYLRANPEPGRALMRENRSYVFFRVLAASDGGPPGALGIPLAGGVNVAVDPAFVPLGAPAYLAGQTVEGPLARIVVAADTGGAIKGANRLDIFFGAGERAERLAGGQSARGRLWLLLPRAAAARLATTP